MGIVGDVPESFSGGRSGEADDYLRRAEGLVADGADTLDVGSIVSGAATEALELDRTVAAVAALHERFDAAISVRTESASVLQAGFVAGAVAAHDTSGFADPDYLPTAAAAGASVIASHPGPVHHAVGPDPSGAVCGVLADLARRAEAAGIPSGRVLLGSGALDPTIASSLAVLRNLDSLSGLGWSVMLSAPAPSVGDSDDAAFATTAALALGIGQGARVVRTHDVKTARRVAAVMARLLEARDATRIEAA